ncbi:MAG: hypothetical protein L6455_03070 [Kiritimatiellae bacterium]|nr:hypothetical protein [Verrucomicrobiota bacterium]MCG2678938.1 hypothetical protein [Kiritimatiellia bacterium]
MEKKETGIDIDLVETVLDGQAELDDSREAMSAMLLGVMISGFTGMFG